MKQRTKLMVGALMSASLMTVASTSASAQDDVQISKSLSLVGMQKYATTNMTYTTAAAAQTTSRTSAYNGVGSLFVTTKSTATTGLGFLCTGSLVNATTVLTAAHCLYGNDESTGASDPVTSITFYLPSFGERKQAGVQIFSANAFAYNPGYDDPTNPGFGDSFSGNDVALFTLSNAAAGHDTYSLYTGNSPLGQYTEVGTGTIGGPKGTDVGTTDDYEKRVGTNLFEYTGSTFGVSDGVLFSDFDDGTAAHDVFGRIGLASQLGVAGGDANSSPGDSGGPEFNALGQIISVTSFGITGGIFNTTTAFPDGFCGNGSIDPYSSGGGTTRMSVDSGGCTNSSVGELAGDTSVAYNMAFINAYLNGTANKTALTAVPEPASWALMIAGFGMVGAAARRRRVKTQVAFG